MTESVIEAILRREGGWSDRAADRGGQTNYGITLATLSEYLGRPAAEHELRTLPIGRAREIYQHMYISQPGFDQLHDEALKGLLIDCGVNHGPRRAVKWLQAALRVSQDGRIGPVTLTELQRRDPSSVYRRVLAHRVRFYGRLVSGDPELRRATQAGFNLQAVFMAGWANRVSEFIEKRIEH